MAHNLKPNTHYRILTILVAVPEALDDGEIYDGLNEMLRPAMLCDEGVFGDYAISFLPEAPCYDTGDEAEEGEPFSAFDVVSGCPEAAGRDRSSAQTKAPEGL